MRRFLARRLPHHAGVKVLLTDARARNNFENSELEMHELGIILEIPSSHTSRDERRTLGPASFSRP